MFKKLLFVGLLALFTQSIQAGEWETDFAQASTNAAKAGRYILVDFTGSDWCGWCIKLQKEVFSQPEFKTFADANLVCVEIDFPNKKKQSQTLKDQNKALAKQYGIRGYPSIIILSPKGETVAKTGYRRGGAQAYVTHLQEIIDNHKKPSAEQPAKAADEKKE
jgi:thioredoxin-related protein